MKLKIITMAVIFLGAALYGLESSTAGLANYQPRIDVRQSNNEYILSWPRLPYFSYYEVEVLSHPPEQVSAPAHPSDRIAKYRTWSTEWTISPNFPDRTYWRVSAKGLFSSPLGQYSQVLHLAELAGKTTSDAARIKAQPTSFYPAHKPASRRPVLTWTPVAGAVYYEFELLSELPENPNDIVPSRYQLFASRQVFMNAFHVDLSAFDLTRFYWRVRALGYDGNPLSVFSDATELHSNPELPPVSKPLIPASLNEIKTAPLLYPVYSWIPLNGAVNYEVELLSQPPENPNGITPSIYRLWSKQVPAIDCYDDLPRITPGVLYWRVRGLDSQGEPVGVYSDAVSFTIDWSAGQYAATFGDSITHGGGAVSYSPADWEYSYQTYLGFPTINLGRSGDTAETMATRFDQDVLPVKPRFLLIMGGTNSLRGGTPAADVIRDLTSIRGKCLANGIRPIFLTLPPINPTAIYRVFQEETTPNWKNEFAAVNAFIRQQRYAIDLEPHFTNKDGELPDHYAVDGLHLDIEGKKLMAQLVNAHWGRVSR